MKDKSKQNVLEKAFLEQRAFLINRLGKILMRKEDIEDIVQETFVRSALVDDGAKIEKPAAYLYTVARNLAFKKLKESSRFVENEINELPEHQIVSTAPHADDSAHHKRKLASLLEATKELPPQCKKVFYLRKLYGLTHKEIAKELGISTSTVERHITIAIKQCRIALTERGYNIDARPTELRAKTTSQSKDSKQ